MQDHIGEFAREVAVHGRCEKRFAAERDVRAAVAKDGDVDLCARIRAAKPVGNRT